MGTGASFAGDKEVADVKSSRIFQVPCVHKAVVIVIVIVLPQVSFPLNQWCTPHSGFKFQTVALF
jgi:hypothetical protein